MPRKCINHPNTFCSVRGSFTKKTQRHTTTTDLQKLYQFYMGCPLGDQGKGWAPYVICTPCSNGLREWMNRRKTATPFAIPWRRRSPSLMLIFVLSVLLVSQQRQRKIVHLNLNSHLSWWQFTNFRTSREWTGIFITNGMWRQFFNWSHSALFRWSILLTGEDFITKWFNQQKLNYLIRDLPLSIDKACL